MSAGSIKASNSSSPGRKGVVWQPTRLPGLPAADISALLAGGDRSGALLHSGHLLLWGRGLAGAVDSATPQAVAVPAGPAGTPLGYSAWAKVRGGSS
jgi:hypothetical protein